MARVAVIINEFGEIGLDHLLVEATDEDLVLLKNGCLCCSIRSDLVRALRRLYVRRAANEITIFDRVVIETTGVADPISIIQCLIRDQLLADCYRLDGVVATVDAVTGMATLDRQDEAVKQAAVADRILLTKVDLAAPGEREALTARLRAINPAAPITAVVYGVVSAPLLLNLGFYNTATKSLQVQRWLDAGVYAGGQDHHHHTESDGRRGAPGGPSAEPTIDVNRHNDHIRSFCLTYDRPLDWEKLASLMQALINVRGGDILRVKGIVNVIGRDTPLIIHGVQHLFHPPISLDAWPDADHRSRLVFITRDVDRAFVTGALADLDGG